MFVRGAVSPRTKCSPNCFCEEQRLIRFLYYRSVGKSSGVNIIAGYAGDENEGCVVFGQNFGNRYAGAGPPVELYVEYGEVDLRTVAQRRNRVDGVANANHTFGAGRFQNLLDVERDQELVIQHQAALASNQCLDVRQNDFPLHPMMELFLVLRIGIDGI